MKKGRPKIAVLGPMPPSSGGVCTNIQNLLHSPLREKYCFLPFRTCSCTYGTEDYSTEKLYMRVVLFIKKIFCFVVFLCRFSPDVIHLNPSFGYYSFWRDAVFLLISKVFRKKVILHFHGGTLAEFQIKYDIYIRNLIHWIIKTSDKTVVLSSEQRESICTLNIHNKVLVVPNMICADKFKIRGNFRKELDIAQEYHVILFVAAHLYKEKGVWDVVRSIPIVLNECKRILFVFVGGGEEEESLKKYCEEQNLNNHVRFVGHLYDEKLIKTYLASDIFVLPTYYSEGFPLVILEAMASGLPVISTPIRGIPDIIEDGVNGFLIEPQHPEMLARKIIFLITNKAIRTQMSRKNMEKTAERFDVNQVAKEFDIIYSELLTRNYQ